VFDFEGSTGLRALCNSTLHDNDLLDVHFVRFLAIMHFLHSAAARPGGPY
jgi:hypothetical protein